METAQSLREDFNTKLEKLQKKCRHTKSEWTQNWMENWDWERVCLRCGKTLEIDSLRAITTTTGTNSYILM